MLRYYNMTTSTIIISRIVALMLTAACVLFFFRRRHTEPYVNGVAYKLYYISSHEDRYIFDAKAFDAPKLMANKVSKNIMLSNELNTIVGYELENGQLLLKLKKPVHAVLKDNQVMTLMVFDA
jgi:hypothetical protein